MKKTSASAQKPRPLSPDPPTGSEVRILDLGWGGRDVWAWLFARPRVSGCSWVGRVGGGRSGQGGARCSAGVGEQAGPPVLPGPAGGQVQGEPSGRGRDPGRDRDQGAADRAGGGPGQVPCGEGGGGA